MTHCVYCGYSCVGGACFAHKDLREYEKEVNGSPKLLKSSLILLASDRLKE